MLRGAVVLGSDLSRAIALPHELDFVSIAGYGDGPAGTRSGAVRFMKEANAHSVKLEGGAEMAPQVELLTKGGIPVMAHIGFTPQSEHDIGG